MVALMDVKDKEKYFEKLNIGISMSNMWNSLQSKSEVGLDKSEKGYQQIAKSMAGNIARGLNLNANLVECLTMCYGSYFPAYGSGGKKAIMQFLQEKGINMTEGELAKNYVEYDLSSSGNVITPEFDQYLTELFGGSTNGTRTPEVEAARLCGETITSIKRIEMLSNINQIDLLYALTKDVEKECIRTGRLAPSPKLQALTSKLPQREIELDEETKQQIFDDLDSYMEYFTEEKMSGVYEYIGTDER